jgi:4'-phosphopantetheinyl transferase EntD
MAHGDLDSTHDVVSALRTLLPEAIVAGGTFDHWLPNPQTLRRGQGLRMLAATRRRATERCIEALLQASGYTPVRVANGPDGERLWPNGLMGSISHKETLVIGAVCRSSSRLSIGVDLEKTEHDLGRIETVIAPEGLPSNIDRETALALAFSAKEAFFKAQFPVTKRILAFADVPLAWRQLSPKRYEADSADGRILKGTIRCTTVGPWVLSAALISLPCEQTGGRQDRLMSGAT